MILRDYQARALAEARAHYAAGKRSVLIVMATGGGKTVSFCSAIQSHLQGGPARRALVICHRRELIEQAAATIERIGLPRPACILAGRWDGPRDAPVMVASVDTLRAAGSVPEATLVVWDEAHHAVAESWRTVHGMCAPTAKHLLVTATPQRLDGRPMGDVADAMVVACQAADLIASGSLVDVDVYAPASGMGSREHAKPAWEAYRGGRAVVFAPDVRYSRQCVDELRARCVRAEHLDGNMKAVWRTEVLRRLRDGELDVVSNVGLLTEGWDLPALDTAIVARACHSTALWLQICGRVMRPHPGKRRGTVLDLVGAVHRHGLPSMVREFSLDGEGVSKPTDRMALQQCSSCGAVWVRNGTAACPQCGFAQTARERDPIAFAGAKLERIQAAQAANAARGEDHVRALFRRALDESKQRGYHPGWARHRVKQQTGIEVPWSWMH